MAAARAAHAWSHGQGVERCLLRGRELSIETAGRGGACLSHPLMLLHTLGHHVQSLWRGHAGHWVHPLTTHAMSAHAMSAHVLRRTQGGQKGLQSRLLISAQLQYGPKLPGAAFSALLHTLLPQSRVHHRPALIAASGTGSLRTGAFGAGHITWERRAAGLGKTGGRNSKSDQGKARGTKGQAGEGFQMQSPIGVALEARLESPSPWFHAQRSDNPSRLAQEIALRQAAAITRGVKATAANV